MNKAHKQHTKTFEQMDYVEQSKSISAQIHHLELAIKANIRRAQRDLKDPLPIERRIEQVERLVERLRTKYLK